MTLALSLHVWLSGVKQGLRVAFNWFELGPGLHLEDDEKLATRNLRLVTCFLTY